MSHRVGTECGRGPGCGRDPAPLTPICSQIAAKSAQFLNVDVWSKELLWALTKPDRTHQEQPPEKVGHSAQSSPAARHRAHSWREAPGPRDPHT